MEKLRPYHIEALYDTLSKTPCGQYVGGKRRDLSPKQQKRTLSGTTLYEVHQLLHNSFLLAVEWGILIKSPVPVEAPKKTTQERSIWEVDEMRAALDSMEDPILHLTLVGTLREGEVAGLTPEDIDFDAANGMGTFTVNRSMQRVQKDTLAQVDKGCILRIFPDKPISSKPAEVRMGNGKGNPEYWVALVQPGRVLYEMDGVDEQLAREAFALAAAKLPVKTTFVVRQIGM